VGAVIEDGQVGVARISLGGSIARAVLGFVREAARELLGPGTLSFARNQIAGLS